MKTVILYQRKKIKILNNKVRRLRARINSMQSLIALFKEKSSATAIRVI